MNEYFEFEVGVSLDAGYFFYGKLAGEHGAIETDGFHQVHALGACPRIRAYRIMSRTSSKVKSSVLPRAFQCGTPKYTASAPFLTAASSISRVPTGKRSSGDVREFNSMSKKIEKSSEAYAVLSRRI